MTVTQPDVALIRTASSVSMLSRSMTSVSR